ncbi:MAG TPA: hypothetical protein DDZ96_04805 [Porphyromonadaceae bacterium]|jgi:hypothetical protein|nr:hypothetical protein [Porphyromonadaceae bacterium]HBX20913.1 hypothetical protein [Porphyromonadaceae bacterium]HCM22376.1 hypothetical protein [Porphyromonadaceae bacterium]
MSTNKELEELFDDPLLENIGKEDLRILDVPENLRKSVKDQPDYVAQRIPCANFSDYEVGFKRTHKELKAGKRSLLRYNAQPLQEGKYYVTDGVLLFLENIGELTLKSKSKKKDARTRCIYENGTESDIFLETLRKSLATNGYIVTESIDTDESSFQQKFGLTKDDVQDGWIYILKSRSEIPEIRNQKDLFKIGFSTIPVKQRIANAKNDPTYLMAEVEIVTAWKTFNMNTHKFEELIHSFFKAVQFKVKIKDEKGNTFIAREWYVAPLGILETVVNRIKDGSIIHYRYNPSLESLEKIEESQEKTADRYDISGMKILTLIIKKIWFDEIIAGRKDVEYRELKQSTLNRYTWVSNDDGKRYLKKYDAIRFYVGYNKNRPSALVEVTDTTYDADKRIVKYHLGNILEQKIFNL